MSRAYVRVTRAREWRPPYLWGRHLRPSRLTNRENDLSSNNKQQGANPYMLQKTRTSWRPSKIDKIRGPDRGQMLEPGHQLLLAHEHIGGRIPISTMIRARR
jgi:hypothetical protein